ncbi:helix-turn-helix transcriptional regulator [Priestia aryabhattai]|uniref:helix-turn-helix domain-containing protein n=1 Tax=Priestia aryabhattai TaxID=412384 RepID=UPI00203C84C3|nr:helix-turn-helix transcriptional regulator [Priestia aryabhattai]MCM3774004.1 helix-turn-helix transcriptional regulator [Priestia aryabhattai]
MNDVIIAQNLIVLMAKKNIRTILELQERTGVSRVTLGKIINGKTENVSLSTLVRICKGLDCDVSDLVKIKVVV